jgi:hypothetical protein
VEKGAVPWGGLLFTFIFPFIEIGFSCCQNHDMIIALVEGPTKNNHVRDMSLVADKTIKLLEDVQAAIEVESEAVSASLPSATKILQPKDRHMISREHFTDSSPGFAPKSEQLFNGKQLLDK